MTSSDWWLRSGGAKGADQAFEAGASGKADIYLPWPGFESKQIGKLTRPTKLAYRIASDHHPVWFRLQAGVRALLARDVHQVLGDDCRSPSEFIVCWTPDGATTSEETSISTGGTGLAIRVADTYRIPVWNLKKSMNQPENISL